MNVRYLSRERSLCVPAALAVAAATWVAATGCGDAIVVLGDSPGLMRRVAGIADSPGDSLGEVAIESQLTSPTGLAADGEGNFYIADSQNARVLRITSAGVVSVLIDRNDQAMEPKLREPAGLAVTATDLVIADPRGNRLWRVDLGGDEEATPLAGTGLPGDSPDGTAALQADLDEPTGVAIGPDGLVYFSETGNHRIRRIEADGTLVTVAGTGQAGAGGDGLTAGEASFNRPMGIAFGPDVLYIADNRNQKVRRVNLTDDRVATVAGTGVRGFSGDGEEATEARLDDPRAVAVSNDGLSLFIADTGNHRVRLVNRESERISSFAGTGETEFSGDLRAAGETALSEPQGVVNSPLDVLFIADTEHHVVWRTAIGFLSAG